MLRELGVTAALSLLLAAAAHAQAFDGVYRGAGTLTKVPPSATAAGNCPSVGYKASVVFTIAGQSITAVYLDRTASGRVNADGSFTIHYTAGYWGGGPSSGATPVTWSGRVRGSRIEGTYVVRAPGGDCSGIINASR